MPWKETCPVDEKSRFIGVVKTKSMTVAEACRRFSISRKSAYKWIGRFEKQGMAGLAELSRKPKRCPWVLPKGLRATLIALRKRRPHWGPRKMLAWMGKHEPLVALPAASTVGELLKREGLIPDRRRRRFPAAASPTNLLEPVAPNDCWCVDFKGQFVVGHRLCYPLTVTDAVSRFLLGCVGLESVSTEGAKLVFERLFHEYGLPLAIRSDNGAPFASTGLAGLSKLSVWWTRLGIRLERIPPGKPQYNGRHERMHRTLKAEATQPPEATFVAQQRRFDDFRLDFNVERPHEALGNEMPSSVYSPSSRDFPRKLPALEYPENQLLRSVRHDGCIKWKGQSLYVSEALIGQVVGLEEMDDRLWHMNFGALLLGVVDGRGKRHKLLPVPRSPGPPSLRSGGAAGAPCAQPTALKVSPMLPV